MRLLNHHNRPMRAATILLHCYSAHCSFQAEADTRLEQQELLEVLLDNLITHHADEYSMEGRVITVKRTGDSYNLDDWMGKSDTHGKPIEIQLASLLVQEEFFILKRNGRIPSASQVYSDGVAGDGSSGGDGAGCGVRNTGIPAPYKYQFCAGTSCLNFLRSGINGERGLMAPTKPMHTIHGPVPGMAEHGWHRKLAHIFSAMNESTAYYRSNFGIDRDNKNTYYLDEHNQFATTTAVDGEYRGAASLAEFKNKDVYDAAQSVGDSAFLTAEFQSLHRLPKTNALVFTLHKYFAPLSALKETPESAAMMLRVLRHSAADKLEYTLGGDEVWRDALLAFLEERAGATL
jgi:hypothetical protein